MGLLLVMLCGIQGFAGTPAAAGRGWPAPRSVDKDAVGIRLLEIPENRRNDSRARVFIVDHANPGTVFHRRFEVYSTSSKRQHVELYSSAGGIADGEFTFAPARTPNELSSWIRLDRSSVDVQPHGSEMVKATFKVPDSATKGERYAVIWAQVSSAQPGPKHNVGLVHRVGIRAYLDVGPDAEPPSAFQIGQIVPERRDDGGLAVVAAVSNTGRRAVDVSGQLSLFDGPSSLRAGPFRTFRDATLAPGDTGEVRVHLGDDLPAGPWKFRLVLRSGRIERTATGTLMFPNRPGARGVPATLDSPVMMALGLAAFAVVVAVTLLIGFRRSRRQKLHATHGPDGDSRMSPSP